MEADKFNVYFKEATYSFNINEKDTLNFTWIEYYSGCGDSEFETKSITMKELFNLLNDGKLNSHVDYDNLKERFLKLQKFDTETIKENKKLEAENAALKKAFEVLNK